MEQVGTGDPEFWNIAGDETLSRFDYASGIGDVLEAAGTFDLHVELSADQRRVVDHFSAALREITPIGAGHAHGHFRNISTGRLHRALVRLSRPERLSRRVSTATYWQHLVKAAELLGDDGDAEYVDAVRRCRDRVAPSQ